MSTGLMKIPEPIMTPTITVVPEKRMSGLSFCVVTCERIIAVAMSILSFSKRILSQTSRGSRLNSS
ncbi:hypothetical protein A3Q56_02499 [Intoshia linei]|uniref:Uncharacterized protein n=1 Tax=Intoshia linei TaxID=1819745 RepID=A0A177B658_9BILA|nr:hypothetical protein A3Q56_02499 [Intoshia linei]